MNTPVLRISVLLLALAVVVPLGADGSSAPNGPLDPNRVWWNTGGETPTLTLDLGNVKLKKSLTLPKGVGTLNLVLRKFLLTEDQLVLTWKSDGEVWMRLAKKIPGAGTTDRVSLPPGRQITLEISTESGTSVAVITIRKS